MLYYPIVEKFADAPMKSNPLPRLDQDEALRQKILPFCRLKPGEIWIDPLNKHKVGCLDVANGTEVDDLMVGEMAKLAIHDPPYNLVAFEERQLGQYIDWCRQWIGHTWRVLDKDSALYVWLGADQKNHFQPLPDFMVMMREFDFKPRSF
jgi:DNA modification methylase